MKTNDVWKRARRIPVMLITEGSASVLSADLSCCFTEWR